MKIFDLCDKLDPVYFCETVQNKLNNCFVKFDNEIYLVDVELDFSYDDDENVEDYSLNVLLRGVDDRIRSGDLSVLNAIVLDFEWTDPGYYSVLLPSGPHSFDLFYTNEYTWKAGLPNCILRLRREDDEAIGNTAKLFALNYLETPDVSVGDAMWRLETIKSAQFVALNRDIALHRESGEISVRYGGGPRMSHSIPIGVVKDNKIMLKQEAECFAETLDHWGLSYDYYG